jgi:hypothetical protein
MATLSNRSSYTVRVPRRGEFERRFSHEDLKGAREYLNELRQQGHSPKLEQADEHWYVRIRKKGYPELNFDGGPYEDAKAAAGIGVHGALGSHGRIIDCRPLPLQKRELTHVPASAVTAPGPASLNSEMYGA